MQKLLKIMAAATVASISVEVGAAAAENFQKLSGKSNPRKVQRDAAHRRSALALRLRPRRLFNGNEEGWEMGRRER